MSTCTARAGSKEFLMGFSRCHLPSQCAQRANPYELKAMVAVCTCNNEVLGMWLVTSGGPHLAYDNDGQYHHEQCGLVQALKDIELIIDAPTVEQIEHLQAMQQPCRIMNA